MEPFQHCQWSRLMHDKKLYKQQHDLFMAATNHQLSTGINVGDLLYCRIHNRPLIRCYDANIDKVRDREKL